jgi:hypothetical protein
VLIDPLHTVQLGAIWFPLRQPRPQALPLQHRQSRRQQRQPFLRLAVMNVSEKCILSAYLTNCAPDDDSASIETFDPI